MAYRDKKRGNLIKLQAFFVSAIINGQGRLLFSEEEKENKSQMIKQIAAILVTYNGQWDKETIFKTTTIDNVDQLRDMVNRCREIDKKCGIVSSYRIQIFQ